MLLFYLLCCVACDKMLFKWNDQNTLLFLENFKNYQCLWNHKIDEYKDRTIRANAIKSLISDLNLEVTEEDIKHKIKTIRTRYTTELTKIKQSTKSGCSSDDVYVPTLYWFKHAEFLSSVCVPRQSTSSLDALTQNEDSTESEQTQGEQKTPNFDISRNGSSLLKIPSYSQKPRNPKRKIDMPIDRAIKELKTISEQANVKNEDEFDLFCKSLAVQLKKMPLDRALLCQEKLQSVMTQERLTQLSQSLPELIYSDSSSPASPFTINQSPLYQNTTPEYNNYLVTQQQVYLQPESAPMSSPQESNQIAISQTSTQEKKNILSQALQSIM